MKHECYTFIILIVPNVSVWITTSTLIHINLQEHLNIHITCISETRSHQAIRVSYSSLQYFISNPLPITAKEQRHATHYNIYARISQCITNGLGAAYQYNAVVFSLTAVVTHSFYIIQARTVPCRIFPINNNTTVVQVASSIVQIRIRPWNREKTILVESTF